MCEIELAKKCAQRISVSAAHKEKKDSGYASLSLTWPLSHRREKKKELMWPGHDNKEATAVRLFPFSFSELSGHTACRWPEKGKEKENRYTARTLRATRRGDRKGVSGVHFLSSLSWPEGHRRFGPQESGRGK